MYTLEFHRRREILAINLLWQFVIIGQDVIRMQREMGDIVLASADRTMDIVWFDSHFPYFYVVCAHFQPCAAHIDFQRRTKKCTILP